MWRCSGCWPCSRPSSPSTAAPRSDPPAARGSVRTVTGAPFAPWTLRGEAVLGFSRRRPRVDPPDGIRWVPGPTMVTASRFAQSPVGPYHQLAVALPARLGGRVGWCVTHLVVDQQDARTGARLNWGFPAELGTLRWREDGPVRELIWEEREILVRGRCRGPKIPLAVPHRELQSRGDGPVIVPDRLLGLFRAGTIRIQAFTGDPLAALAGRHVGSLVSGANRVVREARTPVGLIAPLRAPVGVTEPLLSELPGAA